MLRFLLRFSNIFLKTFLKSYSRFYFFQIFSLDVFAALENFLPKDLFRTTVLLLSRSLDLCEYCSFIENSWCVLRKRQRQTNRKTLEFESVFEVIRRKENPGGVDNWLIV